MSPVRVVRAARRYWPLLVIAAVIAVAELTTAVALRGRAHALDTVIYEQCVRDELQDAVAVATSRIIAGQLRGAKRRVRGSLPAGNPERVYQEALLNAGIAELRDGRIALEPPDEKPCQTPRGLGP